MPAVFNQELPIIRIAGFPSMGNCRSCHLFFRALMGQKREFVFVHVQERCYHSAG